VNATADRRALFALVAPRLERAHRERKLELVQERLARHRARDAELKAERLVAHRELQMVRAGSSGSARYIAVRARKLDQARRLLAQAQEKSRRLGA
jgi:hypothetical protein